MEHADRGTARAIAHALGWVAPLEPEGDTVRLSVRPFEIVTVRLAAGH